jgi:hypothetical protein
MARAHRSSWERRESEWEQAEHRPHAWADSDSGSDEEPPDGPEAGDLLYEYLVSSLQQGCQLSAKMVCTIAYWSSRAGAEGRIGTLAMNPTSSSGNFSKHLDRCTKIQGDQGILYDLEMAGSTPFSGDHSVVHIPVAVGHELLHDEFINTDVSAKLQSMKEQGNLPALYWDHPVVMRYGHLPEPIIPLSLYMDGVSTTKKDSVLAVTIQNICTGRRHLVALFRKSRMCRCGCGQWCSAHTIMAWLHWQFQALAAGLFPVTKHAGDWGEADEVRRSLAGKSLHFRGALCQIRGDWAEFAKTYGFCTWGAAVSPCFLCNADMETMMSEIRLATSDELPWKLNDMSSYEEAARRCEIRVTLTEAQGRAVLTALFFDRRRDGGRGRSLLRDLLALNLRAGDRLEPSAEIPFPSQFELHTSWPVRAVFWRRTEESDIRHRNPLLDRRLGIDLDKFCIDTLHTMALGIYKNFVVFALWECLVHDVFQVGHMYGDKERDELSAMRMAHELKAFYDAFKAQHPEDALSVLNDFDIKTLGSRGKPTLHAKGAETEGLLLFTESLLGTFAAGMPQGGFLLQAARALCRFRQLLAASVYNPSVAQKQDLT